MIRRGRIGVLRISFEYLAAVVDRTVSESMRFQTDSQAFLAVSNRTVDFGSTKNGASRPISIFPSSVATPCSSMYR